ncbi:MAG: diguanylate cyclase [Oscillospiraceae bacterium]|nr:diguanylate cyclase [Oscillospiraceae bacterium]
MKKNKKLHFAVVFSTIDNTCLHEIWTGIAGYAKQNDIHLTAYFGTYQTDDYDFASHLETCFETIVNSKSLDGVILFAGFLAQHIGINNFKDYADMIPKHIPVVSVSYSMPGLPSVLVDNIDGIYSAVDHLIKVHGKKKIAFVKGPDGHPEAEDRLEGYKRALKANGIPLDDNYILPGYFTSESGREAVVEILDNRKITVDAIAACDDESAIGVLNELKSRSIVVPTDIAVTGFDDDRFSATFIPSISTVRQGFYEIGFASAQMLCRKINNEKFDDIEYITPVFVPRQSCGCFEKEFSKSSFKPEDAPAAEDTLFSFALRNITPLFEGIISEDRVARWITNLNGKLTAKPFHRDSFLHSLDEILIKYSHYSHDFTVWYEVLNLLSTSVESHSDEVDNLHSVLSTLFYSTSLVYDIRIKEDKISEFHLSDARVHLRRATSALTIAFDIEALADELSKSLPSISLNTMLIGLYSTPFKSGAPNANRTIDTLIGFDGDRKFKMQHNSWNPILFSDFSTIDGFDFERERRTLFFIPLFFRDDEVGVMLLPYDSQIPVETYESLRLSISTAIKGAELLTKIQTLSITDELSGLLNRRGFFQFAYSRLPHLNRDIERMPFIMFMDMDGLKYINDTHGHNEGDIAISAFSEILKETLREEDIIGRMGGDEFVVFSSIKSEKDGKQLVNRIRDKLTEYNNRKLHPYNIQSSIGSVILEAATKESFEAAMLSADSLLYEEKIEKKKQGLSRG